VIFVAFELLFALYAANTCRPQKMARLEREGQMCYGLV